MLRELGKRLALEKPATGRFSLGFSRLQTHTSMNQKKTLLLVSALTFGTLSLCAQTAQPMSNMPAPAAPAAPADRIKISGHVEVGITGNAGSPDDHQNFGRLFDDRSNEPLLNQFILTAEQALDADAKGFDWGFKLQGMVGSDARFIHSLGLLDDRGLIKSSVQPDIVEAYLNTHFAVDGTAGGIDVKWGKFVTLEGAEVIDSTGNAFYSHTYIFNFGIPFNHTGALATIHAVKDIDVMLGITRGVNTSLKDNNHSASFHGGVTLNNLAAGKLTLLLSTHIGPETPRNNKDLRYLSDLVAIYKVSDTLTSTTDINHAFDKGAQAHGFGVAQYFVYAIDKTLAANFRGEVWRDQEGFFVAQIGNSSDLIRFLRGDSFTPDPRTVGGGSTTYGALTVGLTWKATDTIAVRPELRYDTSLNDTKPYNDSKRGSMFTAGVDVTWSF